MRIPTTEEGKILVCNAALSYYCGGSFSNAYEACETPEEEKTVEEHKKLVEELSECAVDAMLGHIKKLEKGTMAKKVYVVIRATHDYGIDEIGSCLADSIDEAIEILVDPKIGGLPDHIQNTAEIMEDDELLTEEEADLYWDTLEDESVSDEVTAVRAKVKAEAVRRSKIRFGVIDSDEYDCYNEWTILEASTEPGGETKTYSS